MVILLLEIDNCEETYIANIRSLWGQRLAVSWQLADESSDREFSSDKIRVEPEPVCSPDLTPIKIQQWSSMLEQGGDDEMSDILCRSNPVHRQTGLCCQGWFSHTAGIQRGCIPLFRRTHYMILGNPFPHFGKSIPLFLEIHSLVSGNPLPRFRKLISSFWKIHTSILRNSFPDFRYIQYIQWFHRKSIVSLFSWQIDDKWRVQLWMIIIAWQSETNWKGNDERRDPVNQHWHWLIFIINLDLHYHVNTAPVKSQFHQAKENLNESACLDQTNLPSQHQIDFWICFTICIRQNNYKYWDGNAVLSACL